MPNGAYNPGCHICEFHVTRESNRSCSKHSFIMPITGDEFICRDWNLHPRHHGDLIHFDYVPAFMQSESFQLLELGFLYHDVYPGTYAILDTFGSLQNLILSANIFRDKRFGWSIYLKERDYRYFPEASKLSAREWVSRFWAFLRKDRYLQQTIGRARLIVILDETEYQFKIVDAPRTRTTGGGLAASGVYKPRSYRKVERIVYCPKPSKALFNWLDKQMDVEAMISDTRMGIGQTRGEITLNLGIFAFIEILQGHSIYRMRRRELPDHKKEFARE